MKNSDKLAANHSLETNNVLADIGNMPEIVGVVSKFLDIEKIY